MKYRYRNESEMKDSGVEWIGKVPKSYELAPLKKFFSFEKGKNAGIYTAEYIGKNEGEYPVYSGQTENEGVMGLIDSYEYDLEQCLFTTTVGAKVMTVSYLTGKFTLSQNCLIMINNANKIYTKYIYYYLKELFRYEKSSIPSYMQPSLRIDDLKKYKILTPNNKQQEKIANFLDEKTSQFNLIISKKEELIKKLEEAKKSLISEVVTGKVEVVKTDDGYELVKRNSDEMKDSGVEWLGEIPKGWDVKKIKYVVDLRSGDSITSDNIEQEGSYPVYGGNGLRGYTQSYTHHGEYILIGRQGALCGNINYAKNKFWASEHAVVVTPIIEANLIWLGELLRSMNLNQYSVSAAQPGLAIGMIQNLCIPYVNIETQEIISTYIYEKNKKIERIANKTKLQIQKLKEAKQSLISEAVTGKIEILD